MRIFAATLFIVFSLGTLPGFAVDPPLPEGVSFETRPLQPGEAVISVQITGDNIGDRGITDPPAGDHTIDLYVGGDGTCDEACISNKPLPAGCPDCDHNLFRVTAYQDGDWIFYEWVGDRLLSDPRDPNALFFVHCTTNVIAQYINRPGIYELDLLKDLGDYLVALNVIQKREELDELPLDWGDFEVTDTEDFSTGNGIPDIAEFALLEAVLKDPYLSVSAGVMHDDTWDAFQANREKLDELIPDLTSAARNSLAAYLTIGGHGFIKLIKDLVEHVHGIQLNARDFDSAYYVGPEDDADCDSNENQVEWKYVAEQAAKEGKAAVGLAAAREYARIALDATVPERKPTAP